MALCVAEVAMFEQNIQATIASDRFVNICFAIAHHVALLTKIQTR